MKLLSKKSEDRLFNFDYIFAEKSTQVIILIFFFVFITKIDWHIRKSGQAYRTVCFRRSKRNDFGIWSSYLFILINNYFSKTGSGKTYTIFGTNKCLENVTNDFLPFDTGIVFRSFQKIFSYIKEVKHNFFFHK